MDLEEYEVLREVDGDRQWVPVSGYVNTAGWLVYKHEAYGNVWTYEDDCSRWREPQGGD
jgi:hypothetical protein